MSQQTYKNIEGYRNFWLAATPVIDGAVRTIGLHRTLPPLYKTAKVIGVLNIAIPTLILAVIEEV
ncbi:hypothetical protein [Gloeobacter kilaueensis]|uniref:Uncharacterized protein n=1 Tax=Gloeobacter kilaueensis (strain ATCC BAA-2537 / CCAP 1431/1 / ULC 316 / JS1) TaxID=1183438 RepID=U5QN91_GLOK1|nr:hypothetical protein [Gloeobacter kilaueensis]AGY59074.1 hypothetical protein GKIL_2828 [Gloeobacter kilaueensis JS1]